LSAIIRKPDAEKRVLNITAKAVAQALEQLIVGEVHIIIKVGQGGIKRIDAETRSQYNVE